MADDEDDDDNDEHEGDGLVPLGAVVDVDHGLEWATLQQPIKQAVYGDQNHQGNQSHEDQVGNEEIVANVPGNKIHSRK